MTERPVIHTLTRSGLIGPAGRLRRRTLLHAATDCVALHAAEALRRSGLPADRADGPAREAALLATGNDVAAAVGVAVPEDADDAPVTTAEAPARFGHAASAQPPSTVEPVLAEPVYLSLQLCPLLAALCHLCLQL